MKNRPDFLIYAHQLAKYVVAYASRHGAEITNLKLQKILYYIEGHFLAKYGYSLYPALIEGWPFGATLPSVYYEYSIYGAYPIELSEAEIEEAYATFEASVVDAEQRKLINSVIREKMNIDVWTLCEATKSEQPWIAATSGGTDFNDSIITKRSIMKYFRKVIQ